MTANELLRWAFDPVQLLAFFTLTLAVLTAYSVLQTINLLKIKPVSYTHLTLPTNREV